MLFDVFDILVEVLICLVEQFVFLSPVQLSEHLSTELAQLVAHELLAQVVEVNQNIVLAEVETLGVHEHVFLVLLQGLHLHQTQGLLVQLLSVLGQKSVLHCRSVNLVLKVTCKLVQHLLVVKLVLLLKVQLF